MESRSQRNGTRQGPARDARAGQALVESCLVMFLIGLLLAGLLQLSQLIAARDVLDHAAARSARARTVGFNAWMVRKCARVASIPNAGRLIEPAFVNTDPDLSHRLHTTSPGGLWMQVLGLAPPSRQAALERARIPEYMDSENALRAAFLLDYEDWDSVRVTLSAAEGAIIRATVRQDYPLRMPLHRAFYAPRTGSRDTVRLRGESDIENHYALYLNDGNW